ncbi:MAG: ATPase domain-containing protein [Candidatus Thermoplasmatota archaeon]|nr:ATPase domain-containing protein [Candidatus Thermoplasmatota archaeon]
MSNMIETGIPKLDKYLGGGIPEGKSLLFYISPEVEESNMGIHVLHHNLEKGKDCVYVISESSPKHLEQSFREFGWDIKKYGERLLVVDGYSRLIGAPSEEKYVILEPHDILSYEDVANEMLENLPSNTVVVFDSLSNMMDLCGERETLQGIYRINEEIGKRNGVSIYNFTAWPYKESIIYRIKRGFDGIVEITPTSNGVFTGQKYQVSKTNWDGKLGKPVMFRTYKPGGIRIYIPKILVMGPFRSGKTTFIKTLSKQFTSVDRLGATIAIEHGTVDRAGCRAEVFGIPGQERFSPLVEKMGASATGAILVIDSSNPEYFGDAIKMANNIRNEKIPYVIVANKQDLTGALNEEEIKNRMGIRDVPVIKTVATEGRGIFEAFEVLVDKIIEGGEYAG